MTDERRVRVTETIFDHAKDGKRYYEFLLPEPRERGHYRQTMTFNAFFYGVVGGRNWTTKRLFLACRLWSDPWLEAEPTEIITCKDIWEFYETIGYDYRKKKYRSGEDIIRR